MGKSNSFSETELNIKLGKGIRFLREDKGYTLESLSKILKSNHGLKISHNLLGKIERGESKIQIDQFIILCKFYKVNLDFFFKEFRIDESVQIKMDDLFQNRFATKIIQTVLEIMRTDRSENDLIQFLNFFLSWYKNVKKIKIATPRPILKVARFKKK
jgi:transcriptional regulator with XRE-family HTH domain